MTNLFKAITEIGGGYFQWQRLLGDIGPGVKSRSFTGWELAIMVCALYTGHYFHRSRTVININLSVSRCNHKVCR